MYSPRNAFTCVALLLAFSAAACRDSVESPDLVQDAYVHTRARWSPLGMSIAFTGRVAGVYGIHVADTAGGTPALVNAGEGIGVDWSPDGEWLAFSAVGSLYKIKHNGDSLVRLTQSFSDIRPSWSPDGNTIAFVRSGVWLLDLATGHIRQLTSSGDYPLWLSGGSEVMLMQTYSSPAPGEFLYAFIAVDTATGTTRDVAAYRSRASVAFPHIDTSGAEILFSTKFTGEYAQIHRLDVSTGGTTLLTSDGGDHPAWSPDGQTIVYTRTARDDGGLWLMRPDGLGKRRLTEP